MSHHEANRGAFVLLFMLTLFTAWLTHIAYCLDNGKVGFLLAGAFFFPIGIVHGVGIWFGVW